MKQKLSITLEDDLLKSIDSKRGLVDRSSFIEALLKHAVGSSNAIKLMH